MEMKYIILLSSFGSGTVINYLSGSDFLTSYGSDSGSSSPKVTVPTGSGSTTMYAVCPYRTICRCCATGRSCALLLSWAKFMLKWVLKPLPHQYQICCHFKTRLHDSLSAPVKNPAS
jgi:hypothetical protein